jgi:hypothetical protein
VKVHLPPSSAEVKNARSLHGVVHMHRDRSIRFALPLVYKLCGKTHTEAALTFEVMYGITVRCSGSSQNLSHCSSVRVEKPATLPCSERSSTAVSTRTCIHDVPMSNTGMLTEGLVVFPSISR